MARPEIVPYFMEIAKVVATRSTCTRRSVGCVLVNRRNHIVATGYNGVASSVPHCIEQPCPGASFPSGQGLAECQAIHAEANALLQCSSVWEVDSVYCTTSPCMHCLKLLMNTGARNIWFVEPYADVDPVREAWVRSNSVRTMFQVHYGPGQDEGRYSWDWLRQAPKK